MSGSRNKVVVVLFLIVILFRSLTRVVDRQRVIVVEMVVIVSSVMSAVMLRRTIFGADSLLELFVEFVNIVLKNINFIIRDVIKVVKVVKAAYCRRDSQD